jgi:hypothetical protein
MNTWLAILLGGISGTIVMTVFLLLPRWMGWGKIDVIRAVGALMTGKKEKVFSHGLIIHLSMGILFAYLYGAILDLSNIPLNALSGLFLGCLHGSIVLMLVCIMIMEHHPIAAYHEKGLGTGFAQLLAHMLYGLTLGWVVHALK